MELKNCETFESEYINKRYKEEKFEESPDDRK